MYVCMHVCMHVRMHVLHLTFLTGNQDSTSSILIGKQDIDYVGDCFIRVVKHYYLKFCEVVTL